MLRIVGVQRSPVLAEEFVLLQNQGAMKINLRGCAIVADIELMRGSGPQSMHLLCDDIDIPPGQFVILRTGCGTPHWSVTKDGQHVFYTYMQRKESVWDPCEGPIHLLKPQHTYCERAAKEACSGT
jgi:hypothetical protein